MVDKNPYSEGLAKIINEEAELGFNISRFLWPVIGMICFGGAIYYAFISPERGEMYPFSGFLFLFAIVCILGSLYENRVYQKLKRLRQETEARRAQESGEV